MSAHSTLGPSSAERWGNCPGSVKASEGIRLPTSFAAAEGTVAHTVAESIASGKGTVEEWNKRVGEVIEVEGQEVEITEEMIDGAVAYKAVIDADIKKLMLAGRPASIVVRYENRVHASSIHDDVWGTADCYLYQKGNVLKVYDYKFGKGVIVNVEENAQGVMYAVGVMDSEAGAAFDEVEIVIVQPRAPHVEGGTRRWVLPKGSWLSAFKSKYGDAARTTQLENAPRKAGKWCRWCPAAAECSEVYSVVQKEAAVAFDVVPVEGQALRRLPDPRTLSIDKVGQALDWEDTINSWYEALKERMREELTRGTVDGWKLVEGKSNRRWVNEDAVVAEIGPMLGEEALYTRKIKSPAQVEKLVGKNNLRADLWEKPDAPKAIARDHDPRPETTSGAQDAFGEIPMETAPCVECEMGICTSHGDPFAMAAPVKEPMWPQ